MRTFVGKGSSAFEIDRVRLLIISRERASCMMLLFVPCIVSLLVTSSASVFVTSTHYPWDLLQLLVWTPSLRKRLSAFCCTETSAHCPCTFAVTLRSARGMRSAGRVTVRPVRPRVEVSFASASLESFYIFEPRVEVDTV